MPAHVKARITMYRMQELGDCFLLTFTAGRDVSRMLIDCGCFRNSGSSIARIKTVVADIKTTLDGAPLDVVAGTHQHNDHVNGFFHAEKEFRDIGVKQTFLSWLDNPEDRRAQEVGDKFHNLRKQIVQIRDGLHKKLRGARNAATRGTEAFHLLDGLLGFFGAQKNADGPPEVPAKGIGVLKKIGTVKPEYLKPGRSLDMPGLPAGTVRIHVLGPPRETELLYRKDPREGESYDRELAAASLHADRFLSAVAGKSDGSSRQEDNYPFNAEFKRTRPASGSALARVMKRYRHTGESWRTIDEDWMDQAGALALYLDTYTNNSSLALAIELVASRKVLLFAADAQTGNWLSWKNVKWDDPKVTTDSLIERTVFYKAGHHASHNATLPEVFDKMNHPDLVALIPVDKSDPNIKKDDGWKMPAEHLFEHLKKQTSNRVLQMDDRNPPECNPDKAAKGAWKKVGIKPKVTDLSITLDIKG